MIHENRRKSQFEGPPSTSRYYFGSSASHSGPGPSQPPSVLGPPSDRWRTAPLPPYSRIPEIHAWKQTMQKMQTINDTVPLIGEVMNSLVESQQLTSQLQQRVSNLEFNENNLLHNIAELEKQLMESRSLYAQLLGSYSRIVEAQSTSPVAHEPEYQRLSSQSISSQSIPAHASSEYARFNTALQRPVGLTPPPRQQAQAAESQAVPAPLPHPLLLLHRKLRLRFRMSDPPALVYLRHLLQLTTASMIIGHRACLFPTILHPSQLHPSIRLPRWVRQRIWKAPSRDSLAVMKVGARIVK